MVLHAACTFCDRKLYPKQVLILAKIDRYLLAPLDPIYMGWVYLVWRILLAIMLSL